jgi:hypothetical protein
MTKSRPPKRIDLARDLTRPFLRLAPALLAVGEAE